MRHSPAPPACSWFSSQYNSSFQQHSGAFLTSRHRIQHRLEKAKKPQSLWLSSSARKCAPDYSMPITCFKGQRWRW